MIAAIPFIQKLRLTQFNKSVPLVLLGSRVWFTRLMAVVVLGLLGLSNAHALVPLANVAKIAAGYYYTCALTTAGGVKCWGGPYSTMESLTPVDVSGLTSGVTAIAAGSESACALTAAGGVKCWGKNYNGQLGDNSTTDRLMPVDVSGLTGGVTAIAAGGYHTCALTAAGGVKCWGSNSTGQLGDNSTTDRLMPVAVSGLTSGVAAIATGVHHTCALTAAGGVKCWGYNFYGQLGDNSNTTRLTPVAVSGLTGGVTAISAGSDYTCALTTAGGVKCWGWNFTGQLGDNSTTPLLMPVNVMGLTSGVTAIVTGGDFLSLSFSGIDSGVYSGAHTCALTAVGGVKCWGWNGYGQLGDNSTTNRWTPVDVVGLTGGVTAIDAGYNHTCALTAAGGVKCWGDNGSGELGDNSTTNRWTPVDVLTSGTPTIQVPGAPTIGTVTPGNGSASIAFTAPASNGGSPITSYFVGCRIGYNTFAGAGGTASPITVSLTNGTTYTCYVTAINAAGESAESGSSVSFTPGTVQPTPTPTSNDDHGNSTGTATVIQAVSSTAGQIEIAGDNDYFRINIPSSGSLTVSTTGDIDTYGYLLDSNGQVLGENDDTNGRNFSITQTVSAGTYYVRVQHWSTTGTGAYTLVSEFTGMSVPTPTPTPTPTSNDDYGNSTGTATVIQTVSSTAGQIEIAGDNDYFRINVASSGSLTVSTTGGTDTYGYLLDSNGQLLGENDDTNGSNFSITQTVSAGTYYVRVRHWSTTGTGAYTLVSAFGGATTPPGAPTIGTVTPGNGSASIAFTAPTSNGGSAITRYDATCNPGNFTGYSTTVSPIFVSGFISGTTYSCSVTATNAAGTSAASGTVSVTPRTFPNAPTNVTAIAGYARATVSFNPPTNNGGSPITSYTVTSSPGGNTNSGSASPITVTGLTSGTSYTFTVKATNAAGDSIPSTPSIAISIVSPSVTNITPASATLNVSRDFTVTGTNLTSGMGFTLPGCTPSNYEVGIGTSARRTFRCTPTGTAGGKTAVVSTVPGGSQVYSAQIMVTKLSPPGYVSDTVLPTANIDVPQGVERLVLVTHGWNSDSETWPNRLVADICTKLSGQLKDGSATRVVGAVSGVDKWCQSGKWLVLSYNWAPQAALPRPPSWAAINAVMEGRRVAKYFLFKGIKYAHLIGHSAGSAFVESLSTSFKEMPNAPYIHSTFLDAYCTLQLYCDYGRTADKAEQYVDSRDSFDDDILGTKDTDVTLPNALNFDVTKLDGFGGYSGVNGIQYHAFPYKYYIDSDGVLPREGWEFFVAPGTVPNIGASLAAWSVQDAWKDTSDPVAWSRNTPSPSAWQTGRRCTLDPSKSATNPTFGCYNWFTALQTWVRSISSSPPVLVDSTCYSTLMSLSTCSQQTPQANMTMRAMNTANAAAATQMGMALLSVAPEQVANRIRFNYRFTTPGANASLQVYLNDSLVYVTDQALDGEVSKSSGWINVADMQPVNQSIRFVARSSTGVNSAVEMSGLEFSSAVASTTASGNPVAKIAAGAGHTCALTAAGGVKCWGGNWSGQLGDNSTTGRLTPVDVSGLTSGVTAIAAGHHYTCALTAAGGVKCWGKNRDGELGDNSTTDRLMPVDVSGLTSGVTAIAAGEYHTCALTAAGGVKCWGDNNNGSLGDNSTTDHLTPVDVMGLTSGVTAIAAGVWHTCALTAAGGVKCWGLNFGQLGDNSTTWRWIPVDVVGLTSGVTAIATGLFHTCALTAAGGVKCWGFNSYGELGDNSTTWRLMPVDVSGLTSGVTAIAAGRDSHTCALTAAGGVKCWGYNDYGQLGDNSTTGRLMPVDVSGLTGGVTAISAGYGHTCALTAAGGMKCWGGNDYGQLGDTTTTDRWTPVDVAGLSLFTTTSQTISFGTAPSVAVGSTGTVSAAATSGLAVSFSSLTTSICTATSTGTVTGVSAGTCTIAANQAGGASYSAAAQVTQSLTITSTPLSIFPSSASANAAGLAGNISVTADTVSAWTATSNASWLTVTSGSSGNGNGSVVYAVAANTNTAARTGSLTIGGQTFTVMQAGASFTTFTGARGEYRITQSGGSYTVTDLTTGRDDTRTVTSADHLTFSDMTVNLTVQAKAASIAAADLQRLQELYVAFFNRVPAADGLAYWIDQFAAGSTISQIADSFYAAGVANSSLTGFSSTMSNGDFVHMIYRNVLGRPEGAGASGLAYWSGELDGMRETRGSLAASILNSAHSFKGDATYGWVADLLDNKIAVANQFSVTLGLTYSTPEASISNGMAIAAAVTSTSTAAALALIGVGQ